MSREMPQVSSHDFQIKRPYSSRLPTILTAKSYSTEELLKHDKAPFTVRCPSNQQEFLHALREPENDELRTLEQSAYDATLKDKAIVGKSLKLSTLRGLAADRGIRRAALQLALRSFATNEEQRYSGESIHRYVPLSQPKRSLQVAGHLASETPKLPELNRFQYTQYHQIAERTSMFSAPG
jgi:hypothetical protein